MSRGRMLFVGCGPGAPDLLTLRAVRALETADIVIWSPSLLDRQTLAEHTRCDTEVIEWPPATQLDIEAAFDRAQAEDLVVVRLKGGDAALFAVLEPELSQVHARGIPVEIVPGISAVSAAAALLGDEVATAAQGLLLVDAASLAREPNAPSAVAVYGAGRTPRDLQSALLMRGMAPSTPCTVAIEVSRRDATLVSCRLEELAETIEDTGIGVLTLVLAGAPRPALSPGRI